MLIHHYWELASLQVICQFNFWNNLPNDKRMIADKTMKGGYCLQTLLYIALQKGELRTGTNVGFFFWQMTNDKGIELELKKVLCNKTKKITIFFRGV